MYSSIHWLVFWTSSFAMKSGSRTISYISLSDFDLNNDKSNYSSKGRYSKNNHSSRHKLSLINGV